MQLVRIPWAHIPVRVKLDILETEKTVMVSQRNQLKASKETNKTGLEINEENILIIFDYRLEQVNFKIYFPLRYYRWFSTQQHCENKSKNAQSLLKMLRLPVNRLP